MIGDVTVSGGRFRPRRDDLDRLLSIDTGAVMAALLIETEKRYAVTLFKQIGPVEPPNLRRHRLQLARLKAQSAPRRGPQG